MELFYEVIARFGDVFDMWIVILFGCFVDCYVDVGLLVIDVGFGSDLV